MHSSKRFVVSIFELEQLEIRRFLNSASVNSSHVLTINGTSGNDTIIVNQLSNGKVSVSGVSTQFSPGTSTGKFNKISVNAGNGNDLVQINNNVTYTSSTISGSNGNDTLTGGKGSDSIDGDNDNDTLDGGGGGADLLRGDSGEDLANYSYRTDNLNISLDGVANDGSSGEKDNVQCEEVFAGAGNDTLTGSSGDDMLDGGAGNDNIQGEAGDDIVTGSTGSDTLEGQTGSDYIQAKNNDLDQVSGGTDSGGTDHDLASVDPQDIPVPGLGGAIKNAAKSAVKAAISTTTQTDLDSTYGTNGLGFGPNLSWDSINAAAVDSQGRVIFVGTTGVGTNGDAEETDMAVARFDADGSQDTTFGSDGELDIDFTANTGAGYHDDSQGNGVTIDSNDNIFVVGSVIHESEFRTDPDFAVAKIDSNGQLDGNFGGGSGTFSADLPDSSTGDSNDQAFGAAVDGNGNIYLVGDRQFAGSYPSYDVADNFDTANNPSGAWSYGYSDSLSSQVNLYDSTNTAPGGDTTWSSLALQNSSTDKPNIVYSPGDGDPTVDLNPGFYGEYSQAVFTAPSTGEYEVSGEFDDDADGGATSDVHVLVNGQSQFDGVVEDSSQSFDQFFNLNAGDTVGFAVGYGSNKDFNSDTTSLSATVTQLSSSQDNTIAVAKVLPDGSGLDTTYANGSGFNATNFTSDDDQFGGSIALSNDSSPQAVIGGEIDGQFLVAKYTSDGSSLDSSFNNGQGYTTSDGNDDLGQINAIALDSNNNIYAVGEIDNNSPLAKPADKTSLPNPTAEPVDSGVAIAIQYDSNGNVVTSATDTSHTSSIYNGVSIDSQGRIIAVGSADDDSDNGLDYLVTRYDSSLNPDTQFNDVETDFSSQDDVAFGVREMSNGSIVVGGESTNSNNDVTMSAARYIVPTPPPPPGQIPDVEEYITDGELQNPPPELAAFLNRLSPTALEIVQGEPDTNGFATINTGDGNDTVLINTVPGSANKDITAVVVNGITTYYDDTVTHHFYLNTNGGNDTVIGQDAVDNFNLYVYGGSGNDYIRSVGNESIIQGGTGDDYLAAGGNTGNAALVGGSGNDTLVGNTHFDLLIGGLGNDSENGGGGEDIMIGGVTSYDGDQVALRAILDEWRSGRSRSQRISDLLNGGGINGSDVLRGKGLSNQTVFDDAAVDTLDGGADTDWFFRHTGSNADILKNSSGDRIDTV